MLNRDFSAPKREYIKKNRLSLIIMSALVLIGILCAIIFGFNANADLKDSHIFTVEMNSEVSNSELSDYTTEIKNALIDCGVKTHSVLLKHEGENCSLEIRYLGDSDSETVADINDKLVDALEVNVTDISEHKLLKASVDSTDYIFTVLCALLIVVLAGVFVIFRHNISYAISMMSASAFSAIALLSVFAILRLPISANFLYIIIGTIIYTIYESLILFENMRDISSIKENRSDKQKHIVLGMKETANRLQFTAIALFMFGLVLVICGTDLSRQIALNSMFGIIVSMLSFLFVLPFIYNITVDKVRLRFKKDATDKKDKKVNDFDSDVSDRNIKDKETTSESKEQNVGVDGKPTVEGKEINENVQDEKPAEDVKPVEVVENVQNEEVVTDDGDENIIVDDENKQ